MTKIMKNGKSVAFVVLAKCYQTHFSLTPKPKRLPHGTEGLVNPMSEWISVKDRLPENGYVIAFAEIGCEYLIGVLDEAAYVGDGICCYGDGVMMMCVTHWMPLPEPPKGD